MSARLSRTAASSARLVFFAQPVVELTLSDARTSAIFADVACSSKRSSGVRCLLLLVRL